MKYLFALLLITCMFKSAIAQELDLVSPESLWTKTWNIQITPKNHQLVGYINPLDIRFEADRSQTLFKVGELSVNRKILMNAAGTEINPTVFQFDLQVEFRYTFI